MAGGPALVWPAPKPCSLLVHRYSLPAGELRSFRRPIPGLGADRVGLAAGDFTHETDVASVTEAALEFLGGIDVLIVSSGTSAIGSILTAGRAQFEDVITTNLVGPFLAVRHAVPHLIRSAPASVILIASVVAVTAMKERVAYITSKAGLLGMMRSMALDLAEHQVRVNAISPSLVLTELPRRSCRGKSIQRQQWRGGRRSTRLADWESHKT